VRVAIIGIDGLEYELVEKFGMKNLMQEEHGKTDLSDFDLIITPPIWASFLTGLPPEKHGIQEMYEWQSRLLKRIERSTRGIKWLKKFESKSQILKRLGFKKTYPAIKERGIKTIFDYVSESLALNVPTYNRSLDRYQSNLIKSALKQPRIFGKKFETYVYDKFYTEKDIFIKTFCKSDLNLIMGYTPMADCLGHVYRGDLTKMWEAYAILDDFIGDVKALAEENVHILVISDHGMKLFEETLYGDHSDYGFYSSNKTLGLNNPRITCFFRIILNELGYDVKV